MRYFALRLMYFCFFYIRIAFLKIFIAVDALKISNIIKFASTIYFII